ncbi:hypothetical protein K493DRAFT_309277 [Basidiobolus meristosporus CBS 931.73]|uniref:ATPase AAA-type core domain-containing protein n=1 Tax=Basidiobolus meristosporus CBS 931.73 TaxID=1314790 RepID=A0A1Y1WE52_9FUNG|nr:hypothetical protein K493DRAFT_309277 [Basidiobolus meristosporus CBS 931.73]|eukprot:ORX71742.1 hypothetical protein K493DRAFT_309277 [Basidiobolus meristosporus CBS 931.73]
MEAKLQILNLHAGVSEGEIQAFVENANSLARTGPLWVFFDEINTCNHMGLLMSIITDCSLYGQSLSDNLRFFAACNPYRLRKIPTDAAALKEYFYEEQSKLVYQVHPVPEALLDYIWDYGVLSPLDENLYTQHMVTHSMSNFAESQMFAEMLCMSQEHIRSIDGEHSVSLRDIKRAIELARFFRQSLESRAALKTKRASYPQADDIPQRSMVLALVVSYQCRLYRHEDRRKYRENLGNIFAKFKNPITTQGILEIFHHDAIDYFNRMICGDDVAPSEALLENMLATIACILTNIPIFVVGAPHQLSVLDIISANIYDTVSSLNDWLEAYTTLATSNAETSFCVSDAFLGLNPKENLYGLVLRQYHTKSEGNIIESCKKALVKLASVDTIVRSRYSLLAQRAPKDPRVWDEYFFSKCHQGDLRDFYQHNIADVNNHSSRTIIRTFSKINTDIQSLVCDLVKCQVDKLSTLKSEADIFGKNPYYSVMLRRPNPCRSAPTN